MAITHWHAKTLRDATEVEKDEIRAQFASDLAKLSAIVTAPGGTNTARDAQLLDLAQVSRRLLKGVKATVL